MPLRACTLRRARDVVWVCRCTSRLRQLVGGHRAGSSCHSRRTTRRKASLTRPETPSEIPIGPCITRAHGALPLRRARRSPTSGRRRTRWTSTSCGCVGSAGTRCVPTPRPRTRADGTGGSSRCTKTNKPVRRTPPAVAAQQSGSIRSVGLGPGKAAPRMERLATTYNTARGSAHSVRYKVYKMCGPKALGSASEGGPACRSLAHEREELARAEAMAAAAAEAAAQEDEVRCCCVRAWPRSVIMQERG